MDKSMSNNFNWQTEEDAWDEIVPTIPAGRPRFRPWRTGILILFLLLVAGSLGYQQVNRQVAAATSAATEDILSTHRLILATSAQQDSDLFFPLLSGRDKSWADGQQLLVSDNLFWHRPGLGLQAWQPGNVKEEPTVTVSPDLNEAEVTFTQMYSTTLANGHSQVIGLEHTFVYRRGSQRWLLSPPKTEFWGETATFSGQRLDIHYPTRDEAVVQKIAATLDEQIGILCLTFLSLACPDDLHITLNLETHVSLLVDTAKEMPTLNSKSRTLQLILPTPTLIGTPTNEAAYEVLTDAYTIQLLSAIINHLVSWSCCEQMQVQQGLLDYQLNRLGLRLWPVEPQIHGQLLGKGRGLNLFLTIWSEETSAHTRPPTEIYAALDFLIHAYPDVTVADIQRTLADRPSFMSWIRQLYAQVNLSNLDKDWWQYSVQQIANQPPPIPLPEQTLHLLCEEDGPPFTNMKVHSYQFDQALWAEPLSLAGLNLMVPFPSDSHLMLQKAGGEDEDRWQTRLWQNGESSFLFDDSEVKISFGQMSPNSRYLLFYEGDGLNTRLIEMGCEGNTCTGEPLAGIPTWSSDSQHTILVESAFIANIPFAVGDRTFLFETDELVQPANLYRGNSIGEMPRSIGMGYAPVWVDKTRYAYVRLDDDLIPLSDQMRRDLFKQEVVVADVRDDVAHPVLDTATLSHLLTTEEEPAPNLAIHYLSAHPAHPDWLFVAAGDAAAISDDIYIFLFNLETEALELRLSAKRHFAGSLGMSPDGRLLVFTDIAVDDRGRPAFNTHLHNIAQNDTKTLTALRPFYSPSYIYDWSASGEWLAILGQEGTLFLTAPDYDYYWPLVHDFGACASLAWTN